MATIGLELADAALLAVRDASRVVASPGVALVEPQGIMVGAPAAAAARLRPGFAVDRFWSDLTAEGMARPGARHVAHAGIAAAHLAEVWRAASQHGDVAAFAVPGSMRPRQLGLALGIARHLDLPVAGCVDAAVAACADLPARETVLHLDVQLYQSVLTVMDGATRLWRRHVAVAPRVGLRALHAAWAQQLSELMVRRTRFDPLHEAAAEQQLHDRLPAWLVALVAGAEVEAAIETRAGTFAITLQRGQCALAAEAYYTQLVELVQGHLPAGELATLALSARAGALPGLRERLDALPGIESVLLEDSAAAAGAARHTSVPDDSGEPALVTALPRSHVTRPAGGSAGRRAVGAPATHVIHAGRAHALGSEPLELGLGSGPGRRLALAGPPAGISRRHCTLLRQAGAAVVRDHSRFGTFINGRRVDGEVAVAAGDRLRLGTPGIVLEFVAVE